MKIDRERTVKRMNREKVVKGLELCEIGSGDRCYETECPYYGQGCTESLKNDILVMLKEQDEQIRFLKENLRKASNYIELIKNKLDKITDKLEGR